MRWVPLRSPGPLAGSSAGPRLLVPPALFVLFVLLVLLVVTMSAPLRAAPPSVHALVDVRVVVEPGRTLEHATVVLRDGRVEAVGPSDRVRIPADARTWSGPDWTVYAGWIEPWWEQDLGLGDPPEGDGAGDDPGWPGPGSPYVKLHPSARVVDTLPLQGRDDLRQAGFAVAIAVPDAGVLRGRACAVHLGDGAPETTVIEAEVAQVVSLRPSGSWRERRYPTSVMGAFAALRQALLDARHYGDVRRAGERRPAAVDGPEWNPDSEALVPVVEGHQPLLVHTSSVVLAHRAAQVLGRLGVEGIFLGTGGEWRRPDLLPDRQWGWIQPLNFPDPPDLPTPEDWTQVTLDELRHLEWAPEVPALLVAKDRPFALSTHGLDGPGEILERIRRAGRHGLSEDAAVAALTLEPARRLHLDDRLGRVREGGRAELTVLRGDGLFDPRAEVAMVFAGGDPYVVSREEPSEESGPGADEALAAGEATPEEKAHSVPRIARSPLDDRGPFERPEVLLFRGATVWTMAGRGVLENADVLVRSGRIAAVGRGLDVPAEARVVDAHGRALTPGIIDTHSHIAILGGGNEGSHSCTAEVRIRDVLNSEDRAIYEQLAGGVTASHVMHGSANAIGGQCQAIKLRWGAAPEGLVFEGARPTIKFALGENPKRSNVPTPRPTRYPSTRMGVEDLIRERFAAARDYVRERETHRRGVAPRRDLQLEALAEVLSGDRDIHCHSYRQDEILALMRLMEEFDGRVAVFQHVLEGYKIADEIAAHGAGASTFADWWAYKFEVYDAIPQNTSILDERGVLVTVDSDSPDLARRLNTEAAKSVRYGGSSEEAALRMVTLNAARQLGVEDRVGSIEAGKDADLVLWSGHPLSTASVADQTWIEGALYWDREADGHRRAAIEAEYASLLERAQKASGKGSPKKGGGTPAPEEGMSRTRYRMPFELECAARLQTCSERVHAIGDHGRTEVQR